MRTFENPTVKAPPENAPAATLLYPVVTLPRDSLPIQKFDVPVVTYFRVFTPNPQLWSAAVMRDSHIVLAPEDLPTRAAFEGADTVFRDITDKTPLKSFVGVITKAAVDVVVGPNAPVAVCAVSD
jgi:hypothetical protein